MPPPIREYSIGKRSTSIDLDGEDENEYEVDRDSDDEARVAARSAPAVDRLAADGYRAFGKWAEPAGRPRANARGSDGRAFGKKN
jgi:hypothetical protein